MIQRLQNVPTWFTFALALMTAVGLGCSSQQPSSSPSTVTLMQAPSEGIQPVTKVGADGTVHMIYFKGDPGAGNVYYVQKAPNASGFTKPVRVNNHPGSAIAAGTVRGPQMALGKDGRVHVAWMGSSEAQPRGPKGASPMMYTHSTDNGRRFMKERNVIQHAVGLDGGGTVAADNQGNVYVLWHAGAGKKGEENRRVWMAKSTNSGKSFAREVAISPAAAGACGCCGMTATVGNDSRLYVLFRGAETVEQRDMYLLASQGTAQTTKSRLLEKWPIKSCPMSTSSTYVTDHQVAVSWESQEQVAFTTLEDGKIKNTPIIHAPDTGKNRKHPAVAVNSEGEMLLAWTEETGWQKGGSLHWQLFDKSGNPTAKKGHKANAVPVWGRPTAMVNSDGGFTIIH